MDSTIHMFYDEEETYDAILPGIKMKKKAKDLLGKITTNDIRKQILQHGHIQINIRRDHMPRQRLNLRH